MSTTVFSEYRVHHSSPDGVLVQLSGDSGFGRATKESLGGDALAERLVKSFSSREYIPAILRRSRDSQGYRLLSVNLVEAWSGLMSYPAPVRRLVPQLLRKHLLIGLGTTMAARVLRSSEKGTVLTLGPNMTAVAAYEKISADAARRRGRNGTSSDSGSDHDADSDRDGAPTEASAHKGKVYAQNATVEVRLLNYDVDAAVVNATAKVDTVESTPEDTAVAAALLRSMPAGTKVEAHVLLSSTDDGCAVVEVPSFSPTTGEPCSVLGYYIYDWPAATAAASTTSAGGNKTPSTPGVEPPVVGAVLELVVEFSPETPALQDVIHFLVLSNRNDRFLPLPPVRVELPRVEEDDGLGSLLSTTATPAPTSLVGYMPWRGDAMRPAHGRTAEEDEKEDDDAHALRHGAGAHGEPKLRKRRLEEAIDAYERGMEEAVPTSPEEFQRLLLANPNSSYLWTQYMAHHVALQQLEEARQIAEKAIATINPRELEEQLNVWVAYLNVENLYGTAESLTSVFRRALERQLKPFVLHERLADIFAASRKNNQLLSLCRSMTSKFRDERRAWERLGIVLVDQDKRDQLKRVIKDIGASLKKNEAALAIVHIAIHEYKHGSVENGRALFEGLIAKTPRKPDVWSTYIDQELGLLARKDRASSVVHVRNVFERAAAMNFGAKVTHELLARFLAFEKANGTPADVEKVKERARAYVNAKIHAVTESGVPE